MKKLLIIFMPMIGFGQELGLGLKPHLPTPGLSIEYKLSNEYNSIQGLIVYNKFITRKL